MSFEEFMMVFSSAFIAAKDLSVGNLETYSSAAFFLVGSKPDH